MKNYGITILDTPSSTKRNTIKPKRNIRSTAYPDRRIGDINDWYALINQQVIINSMNHSGSL